MIEASITLLLYPGHSVEKHKVTPLEALLLTAEHHKNAGGNPITVHPGTEKQIVVKKPVTKPVSQGQKMVDGKLTEQFLDTEVEEIGTRTNNEEYARLRTKYHEKKVRAVIGAGDPPATFKEALEQGIGLQIPTGGAIAETKL